MTRTALTELALKMQEYSEATKQKTREMIAGKSVMTWYRVKYDGLYYIQHWYNGECLSIWVE